MGPEREESEEQTLYRTLGVGLCCRILRDGAIGPRQRSSTQELGRKAPRP